MQTIIKNKMLSIVVFLALGILMLVAPVPVSKLFVRLFGGVLLAGALVRIIAHFATKKEDRAPISLLLGVVAAAIGLFFLCAPQVVTGILPVAFGVILILNSLLDLVIAVRLPSGKAVAVLLSLLGLILGILIVINPQAFASFIVQLIGASLLYEAVVGIATSVFARKTAKSNLLNK